MGDPQPQPAVNPTYAEAPEPTSAAADSDSMDIGQFNDLDYYGQWYQRDPYGWVWRPSVVMDWQPFTHGHWIWSQYGWMWVDYDPWGWATSHYGYWTMDFTLGWIWVPDYTWSPVQCDWMEYGDYIGWCPVAPAGATFKEPWEGSRAWVWVPVRKFKQADVGTYRATPKWKNTDTNIARGAPDRGDIERRGAGLFPVVDVQLDRRIVRDREFAKVKYPPDQQQIIADYRTPYRSGAKTVPVTSSPTGHSVGNYSDGGSGQDMPTTVGPTQPPKSQPTSQPQAKSKGSSPPPSNSGKTETKYKEKKSEERKDSGKSKDDSKSGKKGKG